MTPKQVERIRAEFLAMRKGSVGVRGYAPRIVEAIYNDYMMRGESLIAVARRWSRGSCAISALLEKWGLREKGPALRERILHRRRDEYGRMAAERRATPKEIDAIIDRMLATRRTHKGASAIVIPKELAWEFRKWPMEKRAAFIASWRAKLKSPKDRPTTPFSSNVTPFDYATPAAREIMAKLNAGKKSSREFVCKLDLASQGVIYKGELYFWAAKTGYQKRGHWKRGVGRPLLHRVIWGEVNGPLPVKHCVIFEDGNLNNFDPDNLGIISMNENARRNQAAALLRKSREQTVLLLLRSQRKEEEKHGLIETLKAA